MAPESIAFDEAAAALIANADAQVKAIDNQVGGVIAYFMAQNKLTPGEWRISDDRRSLVRIGAPAGAASAGSAAAPAALKPNGQAAAERATRR
jgi:hypothetical protein